jgi:hypothetical protein
MVVVAVYRDNARVHCSTLGAPTLSVLATVAETPEFFEKVAGWLVSTFEKSSYPIEGSVCEAKLARVEDEKLEFELIFRRKRLPAPPWRKEPGSLNDPMRDVPRDEYGNVDYRVPPTERTSDDSAN